MSQWLLACKELNGSVYVTRLPQAIVNPDGTIEPGVPDNWYFVGPGTSPSVEAYSAVSVDITATSVTSNVLTVTAANSFLANQTVLLDGTAEAFLNGQIFVVASATATSFTAIFTHANYSNSSDTGTASFNQFILIFSYLSRLIVRVLDIDQWPPNEVNPISIGGGPNPPSAFLFGVTSYSPPTDTGLLNENLIFQVPNTNTSAVNVKNQFDPPYLAHNLIFFDAIANTYTVLVQPDPTWITNIPNTTNYFRLYRSPLGSSPVWTRVEDWNTTFTSTGYTEGPDVGILQWQFSASIGAYFNPKSPGDPNDHEESLMGPPLAFDSTHGPLGFLLTPAELLGLNAGNFAAPFVTGNATVFCTSSQRFLVQALADTIDYAGLQTLVVGQPSTPLQDTPTNSTSSVGNRSLFVSINFSGAAVGQGNDTIDFPGLVTPTTSQPSVLHRGGNAACSLFG